MRIIGNLTFRLKDHQTYILGILFSLFWWLIFYPGLYSVDSANAIVNATKFPVDSHLSVWWIYFLKVTSINGQYVYLSSLAISLILYTAIFRFISEVIPPKLRRPLVFINGLSPVFVGFSVSIWRDSIFASGLILFTTSLYAFVKSNREKYRLRGYEIIILAMLLSVRQSAWLNVFLFVLLLMTIAKIRNLGNFFYLLSFVLGLFVFSYLIAFTSGHNSPAKPSNSLQAFVGDIGCLVSKEDVLLDDSQEKFLEGLAPIEVWKNDVACFTSNVIIFHPLFKPDKLNAQYRDLINVWINLGMKYPKLLIASRVERSSNYLPAFVFPKPTGWYFIDLSSPPTDEKKWQPFSNKALSVGKAFLGIANLQVDKLGYAGLWMWVLIFLGLFGIKKREPQKLILVFMSLSCMTVNILFAPEPDSRYGLYTLLIGQLLGLTFLINWLRNEKIDTLN